MNLWSMWKRDKGGTKLDTVEITVKTPTRRYLYTVAGEGDPKIEVKSFHISHVRPFEEFTLSEPRTIDDDESNVVPFIRVRLEGDIFND